MNNPSLKLCPKCGKPFIEVRDYNSNYKVYVHKVDNHSKGWARLIDYCIVTNNYVYSHPLPDTTVSPLNPKYRTTKPPE